MTKNVVTKTMETIRTWTKHEVLIRWIEEQCALCRPEKVHLCTGSEEENETLLQEMVDSKIAIRLNSKKRPGSYLFRSDPNDVARVESRTFICSERKEEAGPTNHWRDPKEMKTELHQLFSGCMQGRTMYVIPFCMGPIGSPMSQIGIEISDSPYVVCNMRMMTRMGKQALDMLGDQGTFVRCMHSVGVPLQGTEEEKKIIWPCNPKKCCITHFPDTKEIWSFGSGYGGNALLGKKCFALRIASVMAREEGWLAEHMAIIGVTNPEGRKKYFAAAFPSACGKTNFAMLTPPIPGWKVECVGDDIAWMHFGEDGQLYAINPESGFFGVAPGTSMQSNPHALNTLNENSFFTNVALTPDNDVWWEQMGVEVDRAITWKGKEWRKGSQEKAAHPNSRFTVSASQCPIISSEWENAKGVPISAILFGGRRSHTIPLIYEAFNWQHGVFLGASVSSERTAAAEGVMGELRHDPFAMLPFCGYHMGDYFSHWLKMGKKYAHKNSLPKIFYANWFRKDQNGNFIWPGFGDNIRVMEWIFDRTDGRGVAQKSAIGHLPGVGSLNLSGLEMSQESMQQLLSIAPEEWKREVQKLKSYFSTFGEKLPKEISEELEKLQERIG